VVDLFCGPGGFSHGFQQAGHEIILGIDNDKRVKETFEYNHPGAEFCCMDVKNLAQVPPETEIILGSPPCTDFSVANKKRTFNMQLVEEFLRLVGTSFAKYWIMENVPPIKKFLPRGPFCNKEQMKIQILNAADFGVPQIRERCFYGSYFTPLPTHSKYGAITTLDGRKLAPYQTVSEALEIPYDPQIYIKNQRGLGVSNAAIQKANAPYFRINRPSRTITTNQPYLVDLNKFNQKVLARHLPVRLDQVSPTIIRNIFRSKIYRLIDVGEGIRELTYAECATLQGFPSEFKFFGSKTAIYQMIGNAVPPPLAYALAHALSK